MPGEICPRRDDTGVLGCSMYSATHLIIKMQPLHPPVSYTQSMGSRVCQQYLKVDALGALYHAPSALTMLITITWRLA